MARPPDLARRRQLLDAALVHLARRGLADASLRELAGDLDIGLNSLVHHFGSREDLIVACLERSEAIQVEVLRRWTTRNPHLSATNITRRWWRWITSSPENLALARLHLELATLRPADHPWMARVDIDRLALWRQGIADRLVRDGLPRRRATTEATALRALMSGLIVELAAGGDRRRLARGLELGLSRVDQAMWSAAAPTATFRPPTPTP